ncbi:hypothetical protein [Parvicella tangerina]|uniref:Uncharacterized protein n=1 Tax=Parvicella tangerina TaxID=2829795 RepID=A0A916NFM9_9FLAO|nr:hypothetical protein [Parvicella tangerina]CAG5078937.1 hypothetical protein CRYO30217_00811 [Parvicella tangerina]
MKLKKRILYYVIGFVLGLILVVIIFADKDMFGFMPSNRVREDIQNSNIMISPHEKAKLDCMGIDESFIFEMIENADVNFSNSQTSFSTEKFYKDGYEFNMKVKKYELEYKGKLLNFWIAPEDTISIIHTVNSKCKVAETDALHLEVMLMPENLIFKKMLEKDLWLNKQIDCAMECYQITKADVDELFKSGDILLEESLPGRKPNPIYFVKHKINDTNWIFWVEIGATKTRIKYFVNATGMKLEKNQYLINEIFNKAKEDDGCGCYEE